MDRRECLKLKGFHFWGVCCVAPSRDLGTAVGNLIALIRLDGHMKDSVNDWDTLVVAFSLALYLSFRTMS